MDYIGAWIVNQPRLLEEKGFMNWVAFRFSDWGWDGYGDVTVVRRETFEENPDLVRRFLAAQTQGLNYLLENPDESAEIAVVYGIDAQLTKEQALRRFELQEALVVLLAATTCPFPTCRLNAGICRWPQWSSMTSFSWRPANNQ